jgi:ABC-2 type transport system ATP-binding protein/lipopolysaccharide transport system ATP-binding protein|tara:strand:- start:1364 stop:2116 length:753 start_codon:yes stop_codon:yes gene_type:complete
MAHIRLRDVNVDIPVYDARSRRLISKEVLLRRIGGAMKVDSDSRVVVSALHDITLDIEQGDRLGLVGHNGAGKTTLLRVLSGIYPPTDGTVEAFGRVTPIFNISLGMEMDATGYENIHMMGRLLGLTNDEITATVPDIEEFSELGDYLTLPVRTYSSGMLMRLAFGIATARPADIVLIDEALGAGDAAFYEKTQERLDRFLSQSSLLVLTTHSERLMRKFCTRAVLLHNGKIELMGDLDEVYAKYDELLV